HLALAAGAAVLFLAFLLFLARHEEGGPGPVLLVGLFTATVGIRLLLGFQSLADWSQGVWLRGGGILAIVCYFVKSIGSSYRAALGPESGLFDSFVGYTAGVGLCEEMVKALPVLWLLWFYRRSNEDWRGTLVWGLASGAGFGIAEGVIYAGTFYNGIS